MNIKQRISQVERNFVRDLYHRGYSIRAIAKSQRLSVYRTNKILKNMPDLDVDGHFRAMAEREDKAAEIAHKKAKLWHFSYRETKRIIMRHQEEGMIANFLDQKNQYKFLKRLESEGYNKGDIIDKEHWKKINGEMVWVPKSKGEEKDVTL